MSKEFPDYAKTEHPDVIAAVRAILESKEEFMKKARELSLKYTDGPSNVYYNGAVLDAYTVVGLNARAVDVEDLPGQWKKPVGNMIEPYKNNPVSVDFKIQHRAADIPGRGNLIWGKGRLGTGVVFEQDGAVYSHFGFDRHHMTDMEESVATEYGWTEILASEYHKAKEDYLDENK